MGTNGKHTIRTRDMARYIGAMQHKQAYHLKAWRDLDVKINAVRYKILRELEGLKLATKRT